MHGSCECYSRTSSMSAVSGPVSKHVSTHERVCVSAHKICCRNANIPGNKERNEYCRGPCSNHKGTYLYLEKNLQAVSAGMKRDHVGDEGATSPSCDCVCKMHPSPAGLYRPAWFYVSFRFQNYRNTEYYRRIKSNAKRNNKRSNLNSIYVRTKG